MGIRAVAVYSDADADLPYVREADEAVLHRPGPAARSYLDAAALIEAARKTGAAAVHPGYGFLAENADFARRVIEAGLTWVGPGPGAIEQMGDKIRARNLMEQAGVPVSPGTREPVTDVAARSPRPNGSAIPSWSRPRPAAAGSAWARPRTRPGCARRSRPPGRARSGSSAPRPSCWSGTSNGPGTSRCRSSAWPTAGWSRSASVTARCSGGTRRSPRRPRRRASRPSCASGCWPPRSRRGRPSATAAPGPSSAWWTPTRARSSSSR